MVDRIQKALAGLSPKEKRSILEVLEAIKQGKVAGYDLKKLSGRDDIYRIRKGKWRIIYHLNADGKRALLAIERRADTTYNF